MPRRKKETDSAQKDMLNVAVQLRTAPCVPALREAVKRWRDDGYKGAIEYTDSAMNLRNYYPDFIAVDNEGTNWLLETKGQQTEEVSHKDHAAEMWCQNATLLTSKRWQYLKVMQKELEGLRPDLLADLKVLS
jgi:type III restriction enzyme